MRQVRMFMESSEFHIHPARFRERIDQYQSSESAPLRLVYIPTNRDCPELLRAILQEIVAAGERSTEEFQLLLIDDRPAEVAENNRQSAEREAEDSGQVVNWLGVDVWADFLDSLVAHSGLSDTESAAARNALHKSTGSYGAGPNRAALFAAHLGATTLHRRDSDEFPAYDSASGAGTLEVEIAALSTALPTGTGAHTAPFVVGASLDGEPTKDHRDLETAGAHFGAELEAISRRHRRPDEKPPALVEGSIAVGSGLRVERDFIGRTQVGVCASRDVHHWIPEMPAVGVLGSDYFQKGLLYQLDLPVYWHPLRAYHKYEPWRAAQTDREQLGRYVVSELRYAVLRHYWNIANETITGIGHGIFTDDGQFRSDMYADAFTEVVIADLAPAEAVADRFVDVYARAMDAATGAAAERLRIRMEALQEERPQVVHNVRDAVMEFAQLTRLWPRLVSGARQLRSVGQPG